MRWASAPPCWCWRGPKPGGSRGKGQMGNRLGNLFLRNGLPRCKYATPRLKTTFLARFPKGGGGGARRGRSGAMRCAHDGGAARPNRRCGRQPALTAHTPNDTLTAGRWRRGSTPPRARTASPRRRSGPPRACPAHSACRPAPCPRGGSRWPSAPRGPLRASTRCLRCGPRRSHPRASRGGALGNCLGAAPLRQAPQEVDPEVCHAQPPATPKARCETQPTCKHEQRASYKSQRHLRKSPNNYTDWCCCAENLYKYLGRTVRALPGSIAFGEFQSNFEVDRTWPNLGNCSAPMCGPTCRRVQSLRN